MKKRSTSIRRRISILAAACLMVTLCGTAMAAGQSYTHTFKPPHGESLWSVSYTHLDVYKRQTYDSDGIVLSGMVINIDEWQIFEQQLEWSEKKFQIAIEPVSYTHLDVYKRQGQINLSQLCKRVPLEFYILFTC